MKRLIKPAHNNRGFTMIEIVVVLIILAIVSTVVISRFKTSVTSELIAETEGLKTSIRYTQIKALYDDSATWGIHFPNNTSYTLYKNGSPALDVNGSPMMIPVKIFDSAKDPPPNNKHTLQGNVRIKSGVGTTITFDKWGSPGTTTMSITLMGTEPDTIITVTKNTGYIP